MLSKCLQASFFAAKQGKFKHFDHFLFRLILYNICFFLLKHKNVVITLQNEQT